MMCTTECTVTNRRHRTAVLYRVQLDSCRITSAQVRSDQVRSGQVRSGQVEPSQPVPARRYLPASDPSTAVCLTLCGVLFQPCPPPLPCGGALVSASLQRLVRGLVPALSSSPASWRRPRQCFSTTTCAVSCSSPVLLPCLVAAPSSVLPYLDLCGRQVPQMCPNPAVNLHMSTPDRLQRRRTRRTTS